MPPGFTGACAGSPTARRPRSPPPRTSSGRAEQAQPSCPASSQIGTTNVAAGPGHPPVPRRRQDVPGRPVQGRAAEPRRDHPGAGRPLRLRHRGRPRRAPRRPADGSGQGGLRHGAADHRRRADPDALDPGQHRQAATSRSTRPTAPPSRSTRRGSATRARSTDFSSYFHAVNCRRFRSSRR